MYSILATDFILHTESPELIVDIKKYFLETY